ncbi:MAG TPA: hypothetical protein PL096_03455 [Micropepsaceae bacterium]|nr:hypothetical protein [Micropepsaceae bacterium]
MTRVSVADEKALAEKVLEIATRAFPSEKIAGVHIERDLDEMGEEFWRPLIIFANEPEGGVRPETVWAITDEVIIFLNERGDERFPVVTFTTIAELGKAAVVE